MSESANVYQTQFSNSKQTPLYNEMHEYAHKVEVQSLLQRMCADLVCERPDKPLEYMRKWIEAETERTKAQ